MEGLKLPVQSLSYYLAVFPNRLGSDPSARRGDALGGGQFSSLLRSRSSHSGPDIPEGAAVSDLHTNRLPLGASRHNNANLSLLRHS